MNCICFRLFLVVVLALSAPLHLLDAESNVTTFDGKESSARQPLHWAFIPLQAPSIPVVSRLDRLRTAVDSFVEAALDKKGLSLNPETDRNTLLRRLCFDLTGLPPTIAEMIEFLNDHSPDAYERAVDRYLASPHYGERWGKYWLDAAGYADSNGYFSADSNRPLAYRYRDYVIRAFNADKPYDRFVQEQLAGDELAGFTPTGDVNVEMAEMLTATHFLRNAPDGSGESDGNPDEVRTDRFTVLEGNLQIAMNCLLGITIQCARCHAHKFEPIRHEEYYRLQAILFPAYCPDRWKVPNDRVVSVGSRAQRDEHQRLSARIERQIQAIQSGLESMALPLREQYIEDRLRDVDSNTRTAILEANRIPKEKRSAEQSALLKKHAEALKITDDDLAKRFLEFAALRSQVQQAIAARRKELPPPLEKVSVLVESDSNPPAHHLLRRGVHNAPGPEVEPGVPIVLDPLQKFQIQSRPEGSMSSGRRTALARWITSPDNPLLARVMVNRIWQQHFGVGLVATPDNLGQSGARPSHPELLDYLATEFIRSDWSIKAIHRLILNSSTYRQSSASRPEAAAIDPDNRLLWRYPLRRLDAEAVRDGMLAIAGDLDSGMGGPYVPTQRTADGSVAIDESHTGARRRSVYLQQRRTEVVTFLALFDAPSITTTCSARNVSTVPLQSLALLNSDFVRTRAQALAKRLINQAGVNVDERLTSAFCLACGRGPQAVERMACHRFLAAQSTVYAKDKDQETKSWTDLCQMILASNAFLYVE